MPLEPFRLFVGDMHTDSKTAITAPSKVSGPVQSWLSQSWESMVKCAKAEARDKEFVLMLGGDLVDTEGREARKSAEELLQPLTDIASAIYGVPGTGYHVGEDGEEDRSIYDTVKADCKQWRRLEIGGRILDWAHHGMSISKQPWTELNGMRAKGETLYWRCLQEGKRRPDVVIRHHVHRSPQVVHWRGMQLAFCPCWKLPDDFGAKVAEGILPTIGALAWWPLRDRLEIWDYWIPEELAFV